jgi:UDP-N-acetylmuramate--alanine ligase
VAEPTGAPVAVDLSRPRRIHLVGVGGSGMSAIAGVLAAMGHVVTGTDLKDSANLERLRAQGVTVSVGHDRSRVVGAEIVAVSTAIPPSNPEVVAAGELGLPVLRRAEILAAIARTRRCVAVAGTHGKTTTSSMLALVLVEAGWRPSFIIGGEVNEIGTGAAWDTGDWFVIEADESDGTFLELGADAALVTNVEPDHLEHYGDFDTLVAGFERFVAGVDGPVVVGVDDPVAAVLAADRGAVSYGTSAGADVRMVDVDADRTGVRFVVERHGVTLGRIGLPVPGVHNARNATGAVAMAIELGVPFDAAAAALGRYAGVARRFEFRGEAGGVTFVDDYAHLPTEVAAAIDAALQGGWQRVVCVFQPHRFSRTGALWSTFADAFVGADLLVVTDIYAAGERPRPGVTGKLIVNAVLDAHPWSPVAYLPRQRDVVAYLIDRLRPGDLCLSLGAGDLTTLPDELLGVLRGKGAA